LAWLGGARALCLRWIAIALAVPCPYIAVMSQNEPAIDTIIANFELLDDWEDRYRYVIELGGTLRPLAEADHIPGNLVRGCASQVWVVSHTEETAEGAVLKLNADSDAMIVRGLVAITLALLDGKPPRDILQTDTEAIFSQLGLGEHLTAQRANGLRALVQRIKLDATHALAA
jgi:cysteine desulfuration protein SufE